MIGAISWLARAVGRPVPSPIELPRGVSVARSRLVTVIAGKTAGLPGPAAAVALGRTILVHPDVAPTPRLLRHELAHVRQWQRHPWSFPFRYTAAHIRHGYGANPYEAEARAAESGRSTSGDGE